MENLPENNRLHGHRFFCSPRGSALAIGISVGVGIGLAMNNIALGIAIGIAIYSGEDFVGRRRDR